MGGCCLEGCRRFVPGTKREGGRKERKILKFGDREGHGPKRARRTIEKKKQQSASEPKRELHSQLFHQKSFGLATCIQNAKVQRTLLETACIPMRAAVLRCA